MENQRPKCIVSRIVQECQEIPYTIFISNIQHYPVHSRLTFACYVQVIFDFVLTLFSYISDFFAELTCVRVNTK